LPGFAGYVGHTAIDWPLAFGVSTFSVIGSFGAPASPRG
jgi:hypothetical protein